MTKLSAGPSPYHYSTQNPAGILIFHVQEVPTDSHLDRTILAGSGRCAIVHVIVVEA